MCKVPAKHLRFLALVLVTIICTFVLPAPVIAEKPKDYFKNLMVTPEISFAHISVENNNRISSKRNNYDGQWTKEYKCEPGSFATSQAWVFNGTEGNILGFVAQCRNPFTERTDDNPIVIATIPIKKLNDPSVKSIGLRNEDKNFAVGFSMVTWRDNMQGKRLNIGARQLIVEGKRPRSCPPNSVDCEHYEFRCKDKFAICGFQAKILGGNGTLGGSISRMRFRCCHTCRPTEAGTKYHWNISSIHHPQVYNHHGFYGFRSTLGATMRVANTSSGDVSSPVHELKKPCASNDAPPALPKDDFYDDYYVDDTEQCEESEVAELNGRFNASADTWESAAHSIFYKLATRSANRRRRTTLPSGFLHETRPYDAKTGELLEYLSKFKNVGTSGLPSEDKNKTQNETFVCEPGYACAVRQSAWICGHYYLKNPAVFVKKALRSSSKDGGISENGQNRGDNLPNGIPTTKDTTEYIQLPTARNVQMFDTTTKSQDPHFIFSYGLSGKENKELLCPLGSVATGMRVKSEEGLGMTGLEMECSYLSSKSAPALYTKSNTLRAELPTEMGMWGTGHASTSTPITGFHFNWSKGVEYQEGFNVSFQPLFSSNKDARPDDETKFCTQNHTICGFRYVTDAHADIIKELTLKCCPHCIPEEKWNPLELPSSGNHLGEVNDEEFRVQVGLVDMNSAEENHTIDFETRSILQKLFSLRLSDGVVHWRRAYFKRPRPVRTLTGCHKRQDGTDPCKFEQLVVMCGRYKVYTAKVKQFEKGAS